MDKVLVQLLNFLYAAWAKFYTACPCKLLQKMAQ
jgi:hypothetical protein|nr:MAG TPA: hypothetical protein [Caudoviricetes sp.]